MTEVEETAADLWAIGLSPGRHPTEFVRDRLTARGAVTVEALRTLPDRTVVEVGGVVTHRQQPETANGVVFLNLEDETGLVNVICTADVWKRFRKVARASPALCVRGLLERRYDVINLVARRIEPLAVRVGRPAPLPRLPLIPPPCGAVPSMRRGLTLESWARGSRSVRQPSATPSDCEQAMSEPPSHQCRALPASCGGSARSYARIRPVSGRASSRTCSPRRRAS